MDKSPGGNISNKTFKAGEIAWLVKRLVVRIVS